MLRFEVVLASRLTCETWRKRLAHGVLAAACAIATLAPAVARAQATPSHDAAAAPSPSSGAHAGDPAPAAANGHGASAPGHESGAAHGEAHESSPWPFVGKIVNFVILAGAIFYLARKPFSQYLADRGVQIRNDLVRAAEMKDEAGRQIVEIDARLKQLPTELDALRARGRDEVAAEEARINETAAHERERLLEQMRRELDLQLRAARRDLVTHAADLSVQLARERIREHITSDDQARLVDRYLAQVKTHD